MLDKSAKTLFEKELDTSDRNVVRITVAVQQEPEKGAIRGLYEFAIAWYPRTLLRNRGEGTTDAILRYTKSQAERLITLLGALGQRMLPDARSIVLGTPVGSCTVLCGGPAEFKFAPEWGGMYHIEPGRLSTFVKLLKEAIAAVDRDEESRRTAIVAAAASSVSDQLPIDIAPAQASRCAHKNCYRVLRAACPDCGSGETMIVMVEEENLAAEAVYCSRFPETRCASCGWSSDTEGRRHFSEYHCADCGSTVEDIPQSRKADKAEEADEECHDPFCRHADCRQERWGWQGLDG